MAVGRLKNLEMKTSRKSSGARILAATRRQAFRTIDKAIVEAGEVMGSLVAYDTGYLESRNVAESDGQGHGKLENDAPYGIHVEFGTYKMDAQPWFRPARDAAVQEIRKGMKMVSG